ncbi:MAG: sulfotransferase [Pseudomonadota bacterium]|nr:sulfotransferase [Pseudomonadota bacterium]
MPIIVGVPRSGTTLLRMMLDSHPDLAIPPETHFIVSLVSTGDVVSRERFLQIIFAADSWADFEHLQQGFQRVIETMNPFNISEALRAFYRIYAQRFGKTRYGDKTPRYSMIMPAIQQLLPEAHFIHIIRDGRDVALSRRLHWAGPGNDMEAQAKNWVDRVTNARSDASKLKNYIEVRYEALVSSPRETLQKLCQFLSLSYTPTMEKYYEHAPERLEEFKDCLNPDRTMYVSSDQRKALHELTKKHPDGSRIGVWRRELSEDEQISFERIAGPLLNELGYETRYMHARTGNM